MDTDSIQNVPKYETSKSIILSNLNKFPAREFQAKQCESCWCLPAGDSMKSAML